MLRLADLALDSTDDPGTVWHPKPDKIEARDDAGFLRDLTDVEVAEHQAKPEAKEQPDAGISLAAEDSWLTRDAEL